jgi:hypothetical protein
MGTIYGLPLGKEESAEVELLPLKMEDIAVVAVPLVFKFLKREGGGQHYCDRS